MAQFGRAVLRAYFCSNLGGTLSALKGLQELDLGDTKVAGPDLAHMGDLRVLNLDGSATTDAGLIHLERTPGLQGLNLGATAITDASLARPRVLKDFRTLGLALTKVTDAGLVHLEDLRRLQGLNLTGAPITDAGLAHMEGLKELRWLWLARTKVTGAGVERLRWALPRAEVSH